METTQIISITNFCTHYDVPLAFIDALEEVQLIEIEIIDNSKFIHISHIQIIEKLIRLHFELEINIEGLDVVNNLLQQVSNLQNENLDLRSRLKIYEIE